MESRRSRPQNCRANFWPSNGKCHAATCIKPRVSFLRCSLLYMQYIPLRCYTALIELSWQQCVWEVNAQLSGDVYPCTDVCMYVCTPEQADAATKRRYYMRPKYAKIRSHSRSWLPTTSRGTVNIGSSSGSSHRRCRTKRELEPWPSTGMPTDSTPTPHRVGGTYPWQTRRNQLQPSF